MAAQRDRGPLAFAVASGLFFLSGGTGLAYQVIWSKRFSHVWGNSTLAMAAVVASFLFGLGLGAHLLGRVADRAKSCIFWYGVSEAAIGILAIAIPFELRLLGAVSSAMYPLLSSHPLFHSLARFALTFLVIGPPCLLMGGTLPLLIKHFTPPDSAPKVSAGWLYAINTLGAATGAYLAGFHLLPTFGLFTTNLSVAVLNAAIGGVAVLLARFQRIDAAAPAAAPVPPTRMEPTAHAHRTDLRFLYVTVALTGCAALVLEMIWTRQLALMLGGSTYAFSAMLCLLLVGIGLGSLVFHVRFRASNDFLLAPALTIAGICVTTAAGKLLIPQASVAVGTLRDLRIEQGWNATIAISSSAVLELLPAIGMGLLFPLFIDMTKKRAADAGQAIGTVYAWNTVGSIAGATAAFLILVPAVGTSKTEVFAILLYGAALLIIFPYRQAAARVWVLAVCCVAVSLSGFFAWGEQDPLMTNVGMYLYGDLSGKRSFLTTEFFKEGASSNVLVTRQENDISLRVNGKVDASSMHDMNMQLGLTYFPMFLAPTSREICVIGFGSGTTSGASLLFPQTHVTCCEIEPAVVEASGHFSLFNHAPESPENAPRFTVIFDDGRSHLQGANATYDLILSEPSNPWIAGVSNLFTREFYLAARERLAPGGILAQWIQVYSSSFADYAMIARTLLSVFPECALIRINAGDTILLASAAPLVGTRETMDRAQAMVRQLPVVQADLRKFYGTAEVRSLLLAFLVLDTNGIRRFIDSSGTTGARVDLNTDLNMKLEFDAPRRLFAGNEVQADIQRRIFASTGPEWFTEAASRWGCTKRQAGVFHELLRRFARPAQAKLIDDLVATGLRLDPERPELIADKLAMSPPQDPAEFQREVNRLFALSKKEATRLGVTLFREGSFERSIEVFQRILEAHPESAWTWNNLAIAYQAWGKHDEAEKAFQKALAIDPLNEQTRKSYDSFRAKPTGKPAEPPPDASDPDSDETTPRETQ